MLIVTGKIKVPAQNMKYRGSEGRAPVVLNFSSSLKLVVRFKFQSLCPQVKNYCIPQTGGHVVTHHIR